MAKTRIPAPSPALARYTPLGAITGKLRSAAALIAKRLRTGASPTLYVLVAEGRIYAPREDTVLARSVAPEQLVGVFKGEVPAGDILEALCAWRDEQAEAAKAA